ncbi:MAG: hypothetical protein GY724_23700 [Actinomycetia bacterium]|nr:hypothetical protein [Actinomycetes bacterium]MCP4225078.1 hypothetical protein [Actinomycetes bacterium]MCP5031718.1 hypothetical protein [Actinomycetes bacterium]
MGAQDTLEQAAGFVETTGLQTPLMIWDVSFETWSYYGVRGQPTAILVDSTGEPINSWLGFFGTDEVLELVATA